MPTRFLSDPEAMRLMAERFDVHAQAVGDEARRMWASYQTMGQTQTQMQTAFRNIVTMLHGVRDEMVRDAVKYEYQDAASQHTLST
ncbi:WXG100 family type VII secretion target [Mycobacterium sp. SVM_VP21]|nr:WXG100 family type VII secretion target [Mycobacterium sp. SVM_VP21]